mgnify:FL=1
MPVRCRIVLVPMEKQGGCGMIYLSVPDGAVFFMPKRSETRRSETGTKYKKGEESMKVYKKLMNALAAVEEVVLIISTLLILVLTVGNVFSRKVIHRSWSFTEELVVAVFVLITLLAAALACREKGGLVSLTLFTDRLPKKLEKPSVILITVLSIVFSAILFKYGMDKVLTQLANGKRTFVLNWPEWIFWSFVPIGSVCMILHFIEFCLDVCTKKEDK